MSLQDQVAIITGASSGIGRATARAFVDAGAKVVVTGRRLERLEALVDELGADHAKAVAGDICDAAMPKQLIDAALSTFRRLDIAFNNAGIMNIGDVESSDIDDISRMLQVNVDAAVRFGLVVLKHFKAQGSGFLVNTSSILGTKVRPTTGVYAGTKYAIEAWTEALRMELAGSGVRVCALEPGLVRTELQDHWETHPMQTLGIDKPVEPEDIARAVRFVVEQPPHVVIPRIMVLPAQQAM